MKIGIEAQRIFRPKKHGMEVVAVEIINALQQIDTKNEYTVFVKPDADNTCVRPSANFNIVEINGLAYPHWEQVQLPRAAKKYGVDFLHCTSNTAPIFPGLPMMLTLHDIIYLESVNFKGTAYQNFGNLYRRWVVPQVVKNSEIVITVSSFERENIIKTMGLPPEKVTVVYNAVHPRFKRIDDQAALSTLKTQFNLPNKFILFLGNTAPKKNTPGTITAYIDYARSTTNPVPMVILDYAAPLVEQQLKEMNASDLRHLLIIPGYIPSANMPELYNLATIFLYPSFRESFGLPLLEAMACGTPVITSNTSCMPEIAGGACLLMDPFNKATITDAIATLLSEPDRMSMLSELGIARAAAFSWSNAAKQVLDIYEKFPGK